MKIPTQCKICRNEPLVSPFLTEFGFAMTLGIQIKTASVCVKRGQVGADRFNFGLSCVISCQLGED